MFEYNLNTGTATSAVPSDTTTNMSNPMEQQNPYGYYGQPVNMGYNPMMQQQQNPYGYYGQPVNMRYDQMQQQNPGVYTTQPMYYQNPMMQQQQNPYGYYGQPVNMGYNPMQQQMMQQPNPYGYYGQPVQEKPLGLKNTFLDHPDMQRFMREHELDPQDPDDFFVLKTQAQSMGLNVSDAHEPGIKTWEFMAKPKPYMMPNDPAMDPRSNAFNMGVGGFGYNQPDPRTIPYNGGQPFYQTQSIGLYQEPVDQVVHVDGFKMPGSQFIIPEDIKERIAKMQADMMVELEEEEVKRQKRSQGVFNANPYGGYQVDTFTWQNQKIISKYYKMIDDLVEECRQKRSKFNRDLVKMARHVAGEDISDEELDVMFNGYDYTVPRKHYEGLQEYAYLQKFVPMEAPNPYYDHALAMKELYERIYGPDVKGNDRFMTHTSLIDDYYAAEEAYRRRMSYGTNGMFNGSQYLHQLRRNIEQRMKEDPEYRGYGAENSRDKINIFDQSIMDIPTKLQDEMERKISRNYKPAPEPNDASVDPKTLPPLLDPAPLDVPDVKPDFETKGNKSQEELNAEYDARIDNIINDINDIKGQINDEYAQFAKNMLEKSYDTRKQLFFNALRD